MIGWHAKTEVRPVRWKIDRLRRWRRGRHRCYRLGRRRRMQSCREREGNVKDANRYACSGLGTHTHLAFLAVPLRRLLLDEAVAGVGIEGETASTQ